MHMTNEKPLVLVTGGTGKQGGATVAELLAANKTRIRVLTRDHKSPKAQRLAQRGVELSLGDLDDPAAVQVALRDVSAAYSVQTTEGRGGIEAEERQGKSFAEAVKAVGGVHLVYSSVDGAERASGVPHFESKWRIEQHIARLSLPATILRPVAFMENFATSGFTLAMSFGMMKATMGAMRKLQLIAVSDIGWFAARALELPERYKDRKIAIAGDELSLAEILAVYKRVVGKAPAVVPLPGFAPRLMLSKDMYLMLRWFAEAGYTGDIAAIRREHPGTLTFEGWLRQRLTRVQ
jgi:uncharacterized protein YbjT (DUF2867 family)